MRARRGTLALAGATLVLALPVGVASAQQPPGEVVAVVGGWVVEEGREAPIVSALVRLTRGDTVRSALTAEDGRFRIAGVAAGEWTVEVEALGYRGRSLDLVVRADTTLNIRLAPAPIALDEVLAVAEDVTVEGEVVDAGSGDRIQHAQVGLAPVRPPSRADFGHFIFEEVPGGEPVALTAQAVEYHPVQRPFTATDTSLTVALDRDSVAVRMVDEQVARLHERSNSVHFSRRRTMPRRELEWYASWPVHDILTDYMRATVSRECLFIDDRKQWHEHQLWELNGGEIARIEVFDRGAMVRVYTKRYAIGIVGQDELISINEQQRDRMRGCR